MSTGSAEMPLKFSEYKKRANRERFGVWREYSGAQLLIAYVSNPDYAEMQQKLSREHRAALFVDGPNKDALVDSILQQCAASTLLLGWRNIQDDEGNEIPYSSETALKWFKEVPKFFHDVVSLANELSSYEVEALEADSKN